MVMKGVGWTMSFITGNDQHCKGSQGPQNASNYLPNKDYLPVNTNDMNLWKQYLDKLNEAILFYNSVLFSISLLKWHLISITEPF
jgi:hypothetical protein